MRAQRFTVRLRFSNHLTEAHREKVAKNVMDSLIHTINTAGLVPDDVDAYTQEIQVVDVDSGVTITHKVDFNNGSFDIRTDYEPKQR